ncbi:MAG TPA: beta-aspartyl-peptidase [Gemmatimonadales bacterium]|nr:beta-aspartyl-peptidase [Gemmatimonadales bacterium]
MPVSVPLTLLLDAELYDPAPRGRRHLLVAGEQVLWIGTDVPALRAGGDPPVAVEEVPLDGRRVIPGFVDCHVHFTGGGGEGGNHTRVPPVALSRFTTGGTTTVVGLLGTDDAVRTTAELVVTARGLTAEGLTAYCYTGGYHLPPATATGSIRRDLLLIDLVVGVGELAISDHRSSQPTLDELLRVASEVHVGGVMTGKAGILHLHVGDGPRGLAPVRAALDASELPPAVFHPTHVNRRRALFAEALALAERGCVIDITAFPVAEDEDAFSAADALVRYLEAGLPPARVTVSSDAGGTLPVFDVDGRVTELDVGRPAALADTLRTLLTMGQPLERILPAFTSNVAQLLLLPRKGRLMPGADADLVVLDEAGAVSDVMARGRWHVRQGRSVVRGTFERIERW